MQAGAPRFVQAAGGAVNGSRAAQLWGLALAGVSAAIALSLQLDWHPTVAVLGGLAIFGVIFAVNSSVHSYLILAYTDSDKVALDVGFYYMANAPGRLIGTLLSGVAYLTGGLPACLWTATLLAVAAAGLAFRLPATHETPASTPGLVKT